MSDWQDRYTQDEKIVLAAELYWVRKGGPWRIEVYFERCDEWDKTHPDLPRSWARGRWDYYTVQPYTFIPVEDEHRPCCDQIKGRYKLWNHCFTIKHIAALFGVSRTNVLRVVRKLKVIWALEQL